MSVPVYQAPQLYHALKAEGYELPNECADVCLELPVDGRAQLVLRVNVTPELMRMIGRAFIRMTLQNGDKRQLDVTMHGYPIASADRPEK